MAGVKAKRGGPSLPPRWTDADCTECGKVISVADAKKPVFPASRVKVITFNGAKGNVRLHWRHKGCVK
jgi:uncharacterized protein YigE (DUF2233 family)